MRCLPFVCWFSSILAVTGCFGVDGHLCMSTYWTTVTCALNITGSPSKQPTYSLKFTDSFRPNSHVVSCPVVVTNHSYSCVCKIKNGSTTFITLEEYVIELCNGSRCLLLTELFEPSQNIQPTPPHEVEVQQAPKTFNITWKSGYEDHLFLSDVLDYELLLQTSQSKESQTLHPKPHTKSLSLQRSQLKPDATYCVKVRSKPKSDDHTGTWSQWSPSTCWKNEAGRAFSEEDNILVTLTKSLGPVFVAVGVLLFAFSSPAARMKIKTLSHTPSPAPFFQPLFQQHDGNLQEWLSPQGRFVLTHKTEEILTTNAVVIVPKPTTKDPEENQDFHNPPVTQLTFTQCQSSYVGLPAIHDAPPPLTVCPGDSSYTPLPCSVWGVSFGEVEVVSSPPKDFLNISHSDSGCSCVDLTQSPESSLPSSPVDDSPPPCSCSDYCILNKTAEGFAPVLVSKGISVNVPSDALQEDKS